MKRGQKQFVNRIALSKTIYKVGIEAPMKRGQKPLSLINNSPSSFQVGIEAPMKSIF